MNKKWALREKISDDLEKQILFYRGIKTAEDAENFFNPDYERDLSDFFDFPAMGKITSRITEAVKKNEKVVVFGDYDADGVCSCSVFHDFFKKIGFDNFEIYIPDRSEGHGLNLPAIDEFIKQKVSLIITVDCGIVDIEETKKANAAGVNVIIIDHHLPSSMGLPPAFAILDFFLEGEDESYRCFCGAGVVFKVVCALLKNEAFKIIPGWEKWLLDIVAIATIADMFPLVGENRILVYYGLEVLKKTRRKGLVALFQKLGVDKLNVTEDDIGFYVAPCINVASRMDHATISFSLLTTESDEEAGALSQKLIERNGERKKKTEEIFEEINRRMEGVENPPEIIVLGDEKWPVGIVALLANKVLEKYGRPAIIWGKGIASKEIKGSCRSNGRVNLVELLTEIGDKIFTEYGGHAVSTAFTLKEGQISKLGKEVEKAFEKISHYEVEPPCVWLDAELDLEKINWDFYSFLDKFRPFGQGNQKPIFLLKNLEIWDTRTFGNGGIHLRLDFRKNSGEIISAIGFFADKFLNFPVNKGTMVDLAASVEKNIFNGRTELRLKIVDIKTAQ